MFIEDYLIKLEADLKNLFPEKIPSVVDDGANFIQGKYTPAENEFIVVVNSGNATVEKIQNIKSFAASLYLYIYVPCNERDDYHKKILDYLVDQSDNDLLFDIGKYTAGFAYNTPSCDGKAKKINGRDYALYLVMGTVNYVEGAKYIENNIIIDEEKLEGILSITKNIYPLVESLGVIGKRFAENVEIYQVQEINIVVLLNSANGLHERLMYLVEGGWDGILSMNIKITDTSNPDYVNHVAAFKGHLKLQMTEQNKIIKLMNIVITR